MMSEICMQNDTRSRAPISDKQLIGVTRISMLSDKNHMTCIFAPTFAIPTPTGNKANSDYKTDTRIPTSLTAVLMNYFIYWYLYTPHGDHGGDSISIFRINEE